jgi:hypothetical protein
MIETDMLSLPSDGIEAAKAFQWELELIEDPIQASLQSRQALLLLENLHDARFEPDVPIIVRSLSAFVLQVWVAEQERRVSWQFDGLFVTGKSLGIGFMQNLSTPRLQTLFLGVSDPHVLKADNTDDAALAERIQAPHLIIPVLDIELASVAA